MKENGHPLCSEVAVLVFEDFNLSRQNLIIDKHYFHSGKATKLDVCIVNL